MIVLAVALQDLFVFYGILNGNERNVGSIFAAHEEYKAFFAYEPLIVIHASDAVVKEFAFAYKLGRGFGYDDYAVVNGSSSAKSFGNS